MGVSWGRSDTRTLVLMPIAIAINIVLGQTIASVLKIPIYLDSIGTVLVAVLAGPIRGLRRVSCRTSYGPTCCRRHSTMTTRAFAVTAAFIGLYSGLAAQWGFMRSRPNADWGRVALAAVVVLLVLGAIGFYGFIPSTLAPISRSSTRKRRPTRCSRSWPI